ncbi:hypothetical protein EJ04DRAFT_517778 [Polyplosphaeria fusca]|uniref:Uncharacterized protein n=1 Tax=Polyplosphaeria fusca TaxID=682080 RepID=A0A9P4UVS2_9PLEO|nr:hypothetical protein EJ04DRAFT_517778 [Polyplosphaeria fusca]
MRSFSFFSVFTVLALSVISGLANPVPVAAPEPADSTAISRYLANDTETLEVRAVQSRGLGNAVIINRCPHDLWAWSVDQNFGSAPIHLKARTIYREPFRVPCDGCGVALKVSNTDQLVTGKHTQFEYAISNNIVYYDISLVDCAQGESAANCPGHEMGLRIDSAVRACEPLNCGGGQYCPTQAYYVDTPLAKLGIKEPVLGCGSAGTGMDVGFKLCSDQPQIVIQGV